MTTGQPQKKRKATSTLETAPTVQTALRKKRKLISRKVRNVSHWNRGWSFKSNNGGDEAAVLESMRIPQGRRPLIPLSLREGIQKQVKEAGSLPEQPSQSRRRQDHFQNHPNNSLHRFAGERNPSSSDEETSTKIESVLQSGEKTDYHWTHP